MEYKEFTGKTVDDAVEAGLAELGIELEDADIRVLEEGKKKLFGSVKARVEIAPKTATAEGQKDNENVANEQPVNTVTSSSAQKTDGERTVEFLEGLFKMLKITACTELVAEGEKVEINVTAGKSTTVIGKHGAMLDAIQTLAGAVANTGREDYKRVVVDCENYREKREQTLQKLAGNLAEKAMRLQRKIQLEPMNPYERRIIHSALADAEGVKTESAGKEPNRYVVIVPENEEDASLPPIPARSERRDERRGGRDRRDRNGRNNRGYNKGGKDNFKKHNRNGAGAPASGGTSMKGSSMDFFGIFLGNSGNGENNE